ncbi:hypothetical protein LTR85_010636 [Meristemomyces frigidus]|nr:hypothetical protein LTR85_010636 [Meristemomyces frigidus]
MAFGVALKTQQELDALRKVPGIKVIRVVEVYWLSAAYWMYEGNMHTMSMADLSAYNPFLEHYHGGIASFAAHMHPEHLQVFSHLRLHKRPKEDRRYRRLPLRKINQVKQALLELEGAQNLPEDCIPTPLLEEMRVFADILPPMPPSVYHPDSDPKEHFNISPEWDAEDPDRKLASFESGPVRGKRHREGYFGHPPSTIAEEEEEEEEESVPAIPSTQEQKKTFKQPSSSFTHRLPTDTSAQPTYFEHVKGPSAEAPKSNPALAQPVRSPSAPTVEEVTDDEQRRKVMPLIDEIGERVIPLTVAEADAAEQAWIDYGEDWSHQCGAL